MRIFIIERISVESFFIQQIGSALLFKLHHIAKPFLFDLFRRFTGDDILPDIVHADQLFEEGSEE